MGRIPRPWNYGEQIDALAQQAKVDRGEPLVWQPERTPVAFQVVLSKPRKPWGEIIVEQSGWSRGLYRVVTRHMATGKRLYWGAYNFRSNAQLVLQKLLRVDWAIYREEMRRYEDSERKADEAAAGIAVRRQRDRQEHTSR